MASKRGRAAARRAGTHHETMTARHLAKVTGEQRIERRAKEGANDRGDITGVMLLGERVVIECKNSARLEPGPWLDEAERERANDKAAFGVVVAKRHGKSDPGKAVVLMDLDTFARIIKTDMDKETR